MLREISKTELAEILEKHAKWLREEDGGSRADLRYANLSSADLSSADLSSADLRYANLRSANLRSADLSSADLRYANLSSADLSSADLSSANLGSADLSSADLRSANLRSADLSSADLRSANLRYANLRSANLRSADLSYIKEDFLAKLAVVPAESTGLYKAVLDGKIDGSCYEGECCCFVGTVAKNMGVYYESINGLTPDSDSPTERFFMAIDKGDTPENNQVSAAVKDWLEEFMTARGIKVPQRQVMWS